MTPQLLQRLFWQTKSVINRPIALIDRTGRAQAGFNDFTWSKIELVEPLRPSQPQALDDKLTAIPVYWEGKFFCAIVIESSEEAIIEVVASLAQLILQQFGEEFRPKPDAVDLLLTRLVHRPETIDSQELGQQINALGFRLDTGRVALVVELKGFWQNYLRTSPESTDKGTLIASKKTELNQALNSFFTKNRDNLVGFIGQDRFIILKDLASSDYRRFSELLTDHYQQITDPLKNVYLTEVTIGIGLPADSMTGLVRSIKEANQALIIGSKLRGPGQLLQFVELGVWPLLLEGEIASKREFAARALHRLRDNEMKETLKVFLESDINLSETAVRLKVHRNTVIYRMNKLSAELGRDPRHFQDAVELHLALTFERYFDYQPLPDTASRSEDLTEDQGQIVKEV